MENNNQPIRITYSQIFLIGIIVFAFLLFLAKPIYILNEGEQAVITRFGQITKIQTNAGVQFKIPVIDKVTKYSKKILSWDGAAKSIPTSEKQFIWVDPTARWKISDPRKFYASINTMEQAFSRLDDVIESSVRTVISQHNLVEAVRDTDNILNAQDKSEEAFLPSNDSTPDEKITQEQGLNEISDLVSQREIQPSIKQGRRELSKIMLESVQELTLDYGIEVIDIIIRQIRYSDELTESVYNRMISERKQKAQAYRSWGEGRKKEWLGQLDNEKRTILSQAYAESENIKGEADAEAAAIYSQAYQQNADFFRFWRAMESYKKTVPSMDKVLSTDLEYFNFLYSSSGNN